MKSKGHGNYSIVTDLLNRGKLKGLIDYEDTKKGYLIKSNRDSSYIAIHRGEKAFHRVRKYLNKIEKVVDKTSF
jgi:hypothetical protein